MLEAHLGLRGRFATASDADCPGRNPHAAGALGNQEDHPMKRTLIAAVSLLALTACQREPENQVDPGADTPTAEDAASEASAAADGAGSGDATGSAPAGSGSAP